jgi:hypothetical protein
MNAPRSVPTILLSDVNQRHGNRYGEKAEIINFGFLLKNCTAWGSQFEPLTPFIEKMSYVSRFKAM